MSGPGTQTYRGGCHCGRVRFEVEVEKHEALDCNCSICTKKGFLHLIVPEKNFTILQGQDSLTTYTFNTGTAQHLFCRTCGIHSFYRPRSHPDHWDINIRCLDNDAFQKFTVTPFNGRDWEHNIASIR